MIQPKIGINMQNEGDLANKPLLINLEKLQNQVKAEILADEKYWRENSAKMRAIEQKVPTYEDFRQIVLASHLRPLDKGETLHDKTISSTKRLWNSLANSSTTTTTYDNSITTTTTLTIDARINSVRALLPPRDQLELANVWRQVEVVNNFDSEIQWQFLRHDLGLTTMQTLFEKSGELSGDLLGKFICLFNYKLEQESGSSIEATSDDVNFIIEMLRLFSRSKRFGLNYSFLHKHELEACQQIFNRLKNKKIESLTDLQKSYSQ